MVRETCWVGFIKNLMTAWQPIFSKLSRAKKCFREKLMRRGLRYFLNCHDLGTFWFWKGHPLHFCSWIVQWSCEATVHINLSLASGFIFGRNCVEVWLSGNYDWPWIWGRWEGDLDGWWAVSHIKAADVYSMTKKAELDHAGLTVLSNVGDMIYEWFAVKKNVHPPDSLYGMKLKDFKKSVLSKFWEKMSWPRWNLHKL